MNKLAADNSIYFKVLFEVCHRAASTAADCYLICFKLPIQLKINLSFIREIFFASFSSVILLHFHHLLFIVTHGLKCVQLKHLVLKC